MLGPTFRSWYFYGVPSRTDQYPQPPRPDQHLPAVIEPSILDFLAGVDQYPLLGVSHHWRYKVYARPGNLRALADMTRPFHAKLDLVESAKMEGWEEAAAARRDTYDPLWGRLWLAENFRKFSIHPIMETGDHDDTRTPAVLVRQSFPVNSAYFPNESKPTEDVRKFFPGRNVPMIDWHLISRLLIGVSNLERPPPDYFHVHFVDRPSAMVQFLTTRRNTKSDQRTGRFRIERYVYLHNAWTAGLIRHGSLDHWRKALYRAAARRILKRPRPPSDDEAD